MNPSTLFQNDITFINLSKLNSKENKENWIHWPMTSNFLLLKNWQTKTNMKPHSLFFFLNVLLSYKYGPLGRNLEGREVFPPFAISMKPVHVSKLNKILKNHIYRENSCSALPSLHDRDLLRKGGPGDPRTR